MAEDGLTAEADDRSVAVSAFLDNVWYCLGPGAALRPGRMRALTLAGQPVVLARRDDGTLFALRDLCPHRGAPLSAGIFDGREVECCYHGWRFGADGRCTHIPSLLPDQPFKVDRVRTRAWPVRESHGLIWLYFGDGAPDHAPPAIPGFAETARPSLLMTMTFSCHVDHAVIGLLDPAHTPNVHRSWFWRSGRALKEKAKRFSPSELGFTMLRHTPATKSVAYGILGGQPETEIAFRLPGFRIEDIRIGRHRVSGLTAVSPADDGTTHVVHAIWWTIPWLTLLKPVLRVFARQFLGQDRRMAAIQQRGLRFNPSLMLIRDADTQGRWYYQLKTELTRARAAGRPFQNPVRETTLRWRT